MFLCLNLPPLSYYKCERRYLNKVSQKSVTLRNKNEGLFISFNRIFFPTSTLISLNFMTLHGLFLDTLPIYERKVD